jgi:hypothetical protein
LSDPAWKGVHDVRLPLGFDHYGEADVLTVVDLQRPTAGTGQVLVR